MDFPAPEPRLEVSLGGRFFGMGIMGSAVIACIFIEKFAAADTQSWRLPILGAALVLAVLLPRLLFRRVVRY